METNDTAIPSNKALDATCHAYEVWQREEEARKWEKEASAWREKADLATYKAEVLGDKDPEHKDPTVSYWMQLSDAAEKAWRAAQEAADALRRTTI